MTEPTGAADVETLEQAQAMIEHLRTALLTSRRISIAVGILMARHRLTEDAAFAQLSKASQTQHRRVRDIADEVVLGGDIQPVQRGA